MDLEKIKAEFDKLDQKRETFAAENRKGMDEMHEDFVRMQKEYNEAAIEHKAAEKEFEKFADTINKTAKVATVANVVVSCALLFVGALLVKKLLD